MAPPAWRLVIATASAATVLLGPLILWGSSDEAAGAVRRTDATINESSHLEDGLENVPALSSRMWAEHMAAMEADRTAAGDAQFMIQASFGPTGPDLAELGAMTYKEWTLAQMQLPMESHREYWRKRARPHVDHVFYAGGPMSRCAAGSRWTNFAFRARDEGKPLSVQGGRVAVSGLPRTDIDPNFALNGLRAPGCDDVPKWGRECPGYGPWTCLGYFYPTYCRTTCWNHGLGYDDDDCSMGWPALSAQGFGGYVCSVEETIGGTVGLSTSSSCSNQIYMPNPAILLDHAVDGSGLMFESPRPGVLVLGESRPGCALSGHSLMKLGGKFYAVDDRLALAENTLAAPGGGQTTPCANVAKTFLNEATCQLRSSCAPVSVTAHSIEVKLDAAGRELFWTAGRKRVYQVTGLQPREAPCGRVARWRRCDAQMQCAATPLPEEDRAAVAEALGTETGQLRDVTAACSGSVPIGAVVEVGAALFKHVHPQEHDVFDFTAWVDRHPGGAFNIEKWSKGTFMVTVPSNHQDVTSSVDRWRMGQDTGDIDYVGVSDQVVHFDELPAGLQTPGMLNALSASTSEHFEACGSPGEVASDPLLGNRFGFQLNFPDGTDTYDASTDGADRDYRQMRSSEFAGSLWLTMALKAKDQLRQRVAWALSQTFVTSADRFSSVTEAWANYYDIFLRNAFGNFEDLLREVTYSPIMGYYLSYRRNTASDWSGSYPDENYAREIMQLFTIGLTRLDGDGAQTYDNENIMDFARIFTGLDEQPRRANYEHDRNAANLIDPMTMQASWHDIYPKRDLDGGYIGDRYPLCSDLPADAFLKAGAAYEFVGYRAPEGGRALQLEEASALYAALCGAASAGGPCRHGLKRRLEASVACQGQECSSPPVRVVQVGEGFYAFVPPTCVHFFFANGKIVTTSRWNFNEQISCRNREVAHARVACCNRGCTDTPSWYMRNTLHASCENATTTYPSLFTKKCNQDAAFSNNKFCQLTCWKGGLGYEGDDCSAGAFSSWLACDAENYTGETYAHAEAQCASLGMEVCNRTTMVCDANWDVWTPTDCAPEVDFDFAGKVMWEYKSSRPVNKFSVAWSGEAPTSQQACASPCTLSASSCKCPIEVGLQPVFAEAPSVEEALAKLFIGAFPPTTPCSVCDGHVKVYGPAGVFDVNTVFEVRGQFFRNLEGVVSAGAGAFRNPPVFARDHDGSTARTANAEIDALLRHLVHHPNTPRFFAQRLIQRLVSSNPSLTYLEEVAEAFRTGYALGGEKFSGKYGDIGAAVATALLAPEARRAPTELDAVRVGALREPLLKFAHFFRSMEYAGTDGRELSVRTLNGFFGQWPYLSPSVFNFYTPFYRPRSFDEGLVGPEFQIFTTPFAIQFLNGMMDTIDYGEISVCGQGWGLTEKNCSRGGYHFGVNTSTIGQDPVAKLDLLLTGGRLATSAPLVRAAYDEAEEGRKLQAAQQAILMTPEFHTMGAPLPEGNRMDPPTTSTHTPGSYKAFVMVFMNGGADTFNMIVPMGCDLWGQYQEARAGVALLESELLSFGSNGQQCETFGLHPGLPFVKQLYDGGEAAFVSNIGPLAAPMTPAEFRRGNVTSCKNLFSHSDQVIAASTLQCQLAGTRNGGVGGRIADALSAKNVRTSSFSLDGVETWPQGLHTDITIVDRSRGVPRLDRHDKMKDVISGIAKTQHKNIYCEEYVKQFSAAIESSEQLGGMLDNATLVTTYPIQRSSIGQQLQQVARLMATRKERRAERDIFFVQTRGWDMHNEAVNELREKFQELNGALQDFVAEVKAQGLWDSTVMSTHSDFGRTLTSNGQGTDHAWAGNHVVLGGKVQGNKIFNEFPSSLLEGGDQDIGRGRLVPKYPWESVMVPIAEWLGIQETEMAGIFPNLDKFDRTSHIISQSALFKA